MLINLKGRSVLRLDDFNPEEIRLGKVNRQYQRSAAADAVRALGGVLGASKEIEIRPHAHNADVKKRIEAALQRNAEIEAKSISVEMIGREVILTGKVKALAERAAAERALGLHQVSRSS